MDVIDVMIHSEQEGDNFVAKLACLALTIPVSTCTAKRSFLTLRTLKTFKIHHVAVQT